MLYNLLLVVLLATSSLGADSNDDGGSDGDIYYNMCVTECQSWYSPETKGNNFLIKLNGSFRPPYHLVHSDEPTSRITTDTILTNGAQSHAILVVEGDVPVGLETPLQFRVLKADQVGAIMQQYSIERGNPITVQSVPERFDRVMVGTVEGCPSKCTETWDEPGTKGHDFLLKLNGATPEYRTVYEGPKPMETISMNDDKTYGIVSVWSGLPVTLDTTLKFRVLTKGGHEVVEVKHKYRIGNPVIG